MKSIKKTRKSQQEQVGRKKFLGRFLDKNLWGRFIALWLVSFLILESFYFTEVLKSNNFLEIFPVELIFPTAMHSFTAVLIATVMLMVRKPAGLGAKLTGAALLGLLMVNFESRLAAASGVFRAVFPLLPRPNDDLPVISAILLILMIIAVVKLTQRLENYQAKYAQLSSVNLTLAVFIIVGVMALGPFTNMFSVLPTMISQAKIEAAPFVKPNDALAVSDKPDIFYIVLDRYTNNKVLKEQFGFDNSKFTKFLRDNGFLVNENAYSNYPYTSSSIASTLTADYLSSIVDPYTNSDIQTRNLYHSLIRQAPVIKALKDNGYSYHSIGSWYGATNNAPLADSDYWQDYKLSLFGKGKRLRGLEVSQLVQSPYYRFTKIQNVSWWPIKFQEIEHAEGVTSQLNTLYEIANSPTEGGRFVFAHILVPHEPYVFNSDGSLSAYTTSDSNGMPLKKKYIEQVEFINAQIQKIVTTINKQSRGEAIIILNSDEGPYPEVMDSSATNPPLSTVAPQQLNPDNMATWSQEWLEMKFGILQALHIPKANQNQLKGSSSVNIFRTIFNEYLGYDLNYLPNCHYGLNKGKKAEFEFTNVTKKLVGSDGECRQQ